MTASMATTALIKGYLVLNIFLLPLTLLMTFFIGIMGAAAPNAGNPVIIFLLVAAFIHLVPTGIMLWHLIFAKLFDTIFRIVPPRTLQTSWIGLLVSAIALVVLGNVFVDNLYQFRQGNLSYSIFVLGADIIGLLAVAGVGLIPIPFLDRFLKISK